ncbi:MAG: MlaD family protein [Planctomycetota bacterium]
MNGPITTPAGGAHTTVLADARLAEKRGLGPAWILPIGAILLAGALGWNYYAQRGSVVEVRFENANGLQPGALVRHRGTRVGEVEDVVLLGDDSGVRAILRLRPEAAYLARSGTTWWVERPRISLVGVEGLDTILGARYVTLEPGPAGAEVRRSFEGLDEPPVRVPWKDGLEVVLEGPSKGGLAPGAPVRFRQIEVGVVLSVGLASDSRTVRTRVSIAPEYAGLVRENTRFWNASGLHVEAGWIEGVNLSVDSLEALVTGAVAFATPPDAGEPALAGRSFALHARPDDDWLGWAAQLPVGSAGLRPGASAPSVVRAALTWRKKGIFGGKSRRTGWVLKLEDGWLGPSDILCPPSEIEAGSAALEIDGAAFEPPARSGNASVAVAPRTGVRDGWRRSDLRVPAGPEIA